MAIFAKLAYAEHVSPATLLFLRFAIAALLLAPFVLWQQRKWPRGAALWALILMGGGCYTANSQTFFLALTLAPAGTVALLLYLYPALVLLLSALVFKKAIQPTQAGAAVLTLIGMTITLGLDLSGQTLGLVLGVASALLYALYILIGDRYASQQDPLTGAVVVFVSAGVSNGGIAAWQGIVLPHSVAGWGAVLAIAVLGTVLAVACFLVGIRHLGGANASMVSTVEPIVTLVLAALWLGETITLSQGLGGLCILAGVLWLGYTQHTSRPSHTELHD